MVRSLLIRGLLVGLVAGLAAFGFSRWKGEPSVNKAIAFESYVHYDVHHEAPEEELVSRSLQNSAGLGTGAILYGVAMGGVFAIVFSVRVRVFPPGTADPDAYRSYIQQSMAELMKSDTRRWAEVVKAANVTIE